MTEFTFPEPNYDGHTFKSMQCDHQILNGVTFSDCEFIHSSFEQTNFTRCKFSGCSFSKCNLNLIQLDGTSFSNTRFEDCTILGVNWARAAWGRGEISPKFRSIDFVGCVLNYSSFATLDLPRVIFRKCIARDVDFSEATLTKADLTFTDLTNTQFRHTDLSEADLTGATNYSIQPHMNTLRKTRFSLPEALSLLYNLDIEIVESGDVR
jgi:fluoroquinolone resistance protein